ncbi:beta-lactamase/transpeptidase-like protein [Xylariaceae sp. FL0255]|nr:beta-lactamase/transpeptidase-like protein [Xylariaceae sp. FL0255]
MHLPRSTVSLAIASACLPSVFGRFLGPLDPTPVDISSESSVVKATWNNITSQLHAHFDGSKPIKGLSILNENTFSLGLFSPHDAGATALQYHYTGPFVKNSTLGVNNVDGDSIYRVASMTKAITVYAGLLLLNETDWNTPLSKIFPEIASLPADDPVHHVQWDTITPFSLASQISGVPRDAFPFFTEDIWVVFETNEPPINPLTRGLPKLNTTAPGLNVPCLTANCSATAYLKGIQAPLFPSFQTPGYADTNFVLLGRVISRLTGLPQNEDWFQKAVFEPLDMSKTSSVSPTKKPYEGYVVTGSVAGFATPGGISSSSGGVFSTTNDVAKLGNSILNSTLLPSWQTRKWLKPTTFTAGTQFAVGLAWEIYRYTDPVTGHVTDFYTKQGDSGNYASYLVLVPDYDFGFSILMGTSLAGQAEQSAGVELLADLLSEALLPALREQAAAEAKKNYEGTYVGGKGENNGSTSYITLEYNTTAGPGFGLTITEMFNDGVNMSSILADFIGSPQVVLAPSTFDGAKKQRGFIMTGVINSPAPYTGLFSKAYATNDDWLTNNVVTYGGETFASIYFDLDNDGSAISLTSPAMRETFTRKKD